MKKFFVLALALFLLPLVSNATVTSSDIVTLINNERAQHGLPVLQIDSKLTQAAQGRAGVLSTEGRIYHTSAPAGQPWPEIKSVGYEYIWSGENLAVGYSTAEETVMRWMNSPSHRANILSSNYLDIGIGVAVGGYNGRQAPYVVAFFGQEREQARPQAQRKEPATVVTGSYSPKLEASVPVVRTSVRPRSASVISGGVFLNLYAEGRTLREFVSGLTSLLSVARAHAST